MLRSIGTDVKVQQELLRHADIQTTMNVYTQAISEDKRVANGKVVRMVFSRSGADEPSQTRVFSGFSHVVDINGS